MTAAICRTRRRLIFVLLLAAGCNGAPPGVAPPTFDPAAAAARALSRYDANGDRKLSRDELDACPGLIAAMDRVDRDGDGSISSDELQATVQDFHNQDVALVAVSCVVKRNDRPLEGATVTFVPEAFLGDAIKPATGVTARDGTTSLSIADEELPKEYRGRLRGVHCGVYRVTVTHPDVQIAAKYNAETRLGRIVTRRDHDTLSVDVGVP
ncbi:MAG: EF-hand domain-containing protein [Planctomycetia bacterium]|nr:EF-hand domain-containing protein [Planctomycetia bacterium]